MKRIAIFVSWNLLRVDNKYYISGTHFTYLQYASANFEKVYLISSVRSVRNQEKQMGLDCFSNLEIVELPAVDSFLVRFVIIKTIAGL